MKVTKAEGRERLKVLAQLLRKVPKRDYGRFYMGSWTGIFNGNQDMYVSGERLAECGTHACAIGWACTHPYFTSKGLSLKQTGRFTVGRTNAYPEYSIDGYTYNCLSAVAEFFCISQNTADTLFTGYGYYNEEHRITPKHVAKNIEDYLTFNG